MDPNEDLEQLLRDCDLEGKIHYTSGNLSGGQKRKLQLAIGLLGGSKRKFSLIIRQSKLNFLVQLYW
jgi:ABC-type multidrug transport system ATPase subunit